MSVSQRKALATSILTKCLDLNDTENTDQAALMTAALEFTCESLSGDSVAQERLREKYEEIAALSSAKKSKAAQKPMPVPLPGRLNDLDTFNPYAKLDPYNLTEIYGAEQLRAVLEHMAVQSLREAATAVEERNPGTKPKSKSKNTDMIDYIVEHVAGPGY